MVEILVEDEVAEEFGVVREVVDGLREYCKNLLT